jgi:pimeloyl-ACP methyl ester carboxylesterase
MAVPEPRPFELAGAPLLRGEALGDGSPVVLCHGITATRRYVVHGSKLLPRRGYELITYDARAHGESDPAPDGEGYGYERLVADLKRVVEERVGEGRLLMGGHSMGAHTAVAYALEHPDRLAGLVVVGPVYNGPPSEETLAYWDGLADALEEDGVEGFVAYIDAQGPDPEWRDTILRITRERISAHRHPEALAQALREVPRSAPVDSLTELEFLDVPTLVVASHDVADPGHPYSVAEAYAARIPGARLISEEEGESPLAWQGGKLSREIAEFASLISYP